MTLSLPGTTKLREAASVSPADVARTAWGTCQIRLVADRIASLRAGSTHKVYRGWRFAVAMDHGCPGPGTTLFTVPIDPAQLAASRSRYALVQLANQGGITAGDAATRRHLETDGWIQDATIPGCYAKPDPTQPGGAELHGWESEGGTCR